MDPYSLLKTRSCIVYIASLIRARPPLCDLSSLMVSGERVCGVGLISPARQSQHWKLWQIWTRMDSTIRARDVCVRVCQRDKKTVASRKMDGIRYVRACVWVCADAKRTRTTYFWLNCQRNNNNNNTKFTKVTTANRFCHFPSYKESESEVETYGIGGVEYMKL